MRTFSVPCCCFELGDWALLPGSINLLLHPICSSHVHRTTTKTGLLRSVTRNSSHKTMLRRSVIASILTSSTVDPVDIPTVRRSRSLQGQAAEGHSNQQHWSLRTEGVCDHPCYESLEYNYITKFTDMGSSHRDAPSTPESHRKAMLGPDSDGWLASIREESQPLKDRDVSEWVDPPV